MAEKCRNDFEIPSRTSNGGHVLFKLLTPLERMVNAIYLTMLKT